MNYQTWSVLATVAFAAAGAFLVTAVVLFFAMDVGPAIGVLSGRRSARGVAAIREGAARGETVVTGRPQRHYRQPKVPGSSSTANTSAGVASVPVVPPQPGSPSVGVVPPWLGVSGGTTVLPGDGSSSPIVFPPVPGVSPEAGGSADVANLLGVDLPTGTAVMGAADSGVAVSSSSPLGTTVMNPLENGPEVVVLGAVTPVGRENGESVVLPGSYEGSPDPDRSVPTQVVTRVRFSSAKESL